MGGGGWLRGKRVHVQTQGKQNWGSNWALLPKRRFFEGMERYFSQFFYDHSLCSQVRPRKTTTRTVRGMMLHNQCTDYNFITVEFRYSRSTTEKVVHIT